jgi:hypothetical protein
MDSIQIQGRTIRLDNSEITVTPYQSMMGDRAWTDLRELNPLENNPAGMPVPNLSEVTAWRVNEFGQVELMAGAIAPNLASHTTCSTPFN